ncbi:unnamed protein product [Mytilus edulis]|uniref:Ig-like domain-containing protein n=1 Tax=Mytilus edulis TaxID=6550 RepID=A0A8S3S7A3_MYTED|nr:unnamed protein product [Mytilus edulis]
MKQLRPMMLPDLKKLKYKQDNTTYYTYTMVSRKIINVTGSDAGNYRLGGQAHKSKKELNIINTPCPSSEIKTVCAIVGSSPILTFVSDWTVYHNTRGSLDSKIAILVYLRINHVTREDRGVYTLDVTLLDYDKIQVAITDLSFINQTDQKTIVGQEGKELDINCTSVTRKFITALKLEVNRSIIAIGDNHSVRYSFTPDRSNHLTKYKCVDSTHSSILIEVTLLIRYAPAFKARLQNEAITCDCDGNPALYSVHRFNQTTKYGELVRSVNINNDTFSFDTEPFPYQNNGIYTCVVSNGITDTNGKLLQIWSTNVTYEGSPVFSPDNRNVKTGEEGQSLSMSFYIYSYPEVEKIFLEKVGMNSSEIQKIKHYNISEYTLLYTEYNNVLGIQGYEIIIESEVLDIDDFETYRLTAKNRLGKTNYYFEITKNGTCGTCENIPLGKSRMTDFMIPSSIASVLLFYIIIIHICVCVQHLKNRDQRHHNVAGNHNYHTYDEIGTIPNRAVRTIRSSATNDNQGQNRIEKQSANISNRVIQQSNDGNTIQLNTYVPNDGIQRDVTNGNKERKNSISYNANLQLAHVDDTNLNETFLEDGLQQFDITEHQMQSMDMSLNERDFSCTNSTLTSSTASPSMRMIVDRKQTNESISEESTSDDSDSGSFIYGMVGNLGEGYENPYQMILQDHAESHPYTMIIRERGNSNSSTESDKSEEQQIGTGSTKKDEYINLKL